VDFEAKQANSQPAQQSLQGQELSWVGNWAISQQR